MKIQNLFVCQSLKHFMLFNIVAAVLIRSMSHAASVSYDRQTVINLVFGVIVCQVAALVVKCTYAKSLYERDYKGGAAVVGVMVVIAAIMLVGVLVQVGGLF
ncbi:hypothetical protein EE88_21705 [Salmonella enterica]|nr:hypothetical protein [Salmonella enterica]